MRGKEEEEEEKRETKICCKKQEKIKERSEEILRVVGVRVKVMESISPECREYLSSRTSLNLTGPGRTRAAHYSPVTFFAKASM